jgi:serine/threonine protein kinase
VFIRANTADKVMEFDNMYWLREYAIIIYLYSFKHTNIVKYLKCNIFELPLNGLGYGKNSNFYIHNKMPKYNFDLNTIQFRYDQHIIQVMLDILSAVSLLHTQDIWHRDIKPNNIMISNDWRATLIDFSHSIRVRGDDIKLDFNVCACSHRAPEIYKYRSEKKARADAYNEKIDVWSIGIVLYEMIIGRGMYGYISSANSDTELDRLEIDINGFYSQDEDIYMNKLKQWWDRGTDLVNVNLAVTNKGKIEVTIIPQKPSKLAFRPQYWNLICQMLKKDPNRRAPAKYLLEQFVALSTGNASICYPTFDITTRHYEIINVLHNMIFTDLQQQLYECCIHILNQFTTCGIHLKLNRIKPLLTYLIYYNKIQPLQSYMQMLIITVFVDTVIYDRSNYISDIVEKICDKLNLDVSLDEFYYELYAFIKTNSSVLFFSDIFD